MAEPEPTATVEVLGVRFHDLTRRQAAQRIATMAREGGKGYVVKPYSEFMPRAARDERIRSVLNEASLCLPDGIGIVWAAHYLSLPGGALRAVAQFALSLASLVLNPRALRRPLRENMAGVDLTWELLARLDEAGSRVFLLGGTDGELLGARQRIEARFPGLHIAGTHHGYFRTTGEDDERVIEAINEGRPEVLLVAMGFPRQETWLAANLLRLDVGVAVAEGGSFSYISGMVPRAPRWMRNLSLEWLFRLLRQPWRLRRQLALPVFVWLVLRERLKGKQARARRRRPT